MFREIYPEARRGLQYRDGSECPDVIVPWFWVEAKVGKRPNIPKAMEQADKARGSHSDLWVLAVTKRDRERPIASMYLDEFMDLLHSGKMWLI